ncbi:hypothetical protein OQA88_1691 [Cercophora sp. LCS_1]
MSAPRKMTVAAEEESTTRGTKACDAEALEVAHILVGFSKSARVTAPDSTPATSSPAPLSPDTNAPPPAPRRPLPSARPSTSPPTTQVTATRRHALPTRQPTGVTKTSAATKKPRAPRGRTPASSSTSPPQRDAQGKTKNERQREQARRDQLAWPLRDEPCYKCRVAKLGDGDDFAECRMLPGGKTCARCKSQHESCKDYEAVIAQKEREKGERARKGT